MESKSVKCPERRSKIVPGYMFPCIGEECAKYYVCTGKPSFRDASPDTWEEIPGLLFDKYYKVKRG